MFDLCTCDSENTTVLLLKGGTSGEREISLISAQAVAQALRSEGFTVKEVDTGADGYLHEIADEDIDVIYICLHGKYGEDGTVQGLCELLGKPYVGPGVLASALAMDKTRTKVFYSANGLPTPSSITIARGDNYTLDEIIATVGEKAVVKPATEGSALGVTIAHNPNEMIDAINKALEIDTTALVERFIEGIEVTVGIIGNENPIALPVIEIIPGNEFYDFDSKYTPGGSQHICPARISNELTQSCQRISLAAHKALGCKGVSRSDIIIDAAGTCWLLETNTIPGMTQTSLLPDAAKQMGVSFPALCRTLVELAIEEHSGKKGRQALARP